MDEHPSIDARYRRNLRIPCHDVQEKPRVPCARRVQGLQGMAWSAALVVHTRKTPSWLSRLATRDRISGDRRQSLNLPPHPANGNIIHQYLHGERAPTRGPRGKWGFDLTGAVHALPGGAMARLYLDSPLWELIEGPVSVVRAKDILLLLTQHLPGMPLVAYIRAWAEYRLSMAESQSASQQQKCRNRIGELHETLPFVDPVFRFIHRPLTHYLASYEPKIPLDQFRPGVPKSATGTRLWAAFRRSMQQDQRFEDGCDRFLLSGRLPDRRFLQRFRQRWTNFINLRERRAHHIHPGEALNADDAIESFPGQSLYEVWHIRAAVGDALLKRRLILHS